jgi:hypothetical protein
MPANNLCREEGCRRRAWGASGLCRFHLKSALRIGAPRKERKPLSPEQIARKEARQKQHDEERAAVEAECALEDAALTKIHALIRAKGLDTERYDWQPFNSWAAKHSKWRGAEGIPSDDDVTWQFIAEALADFMTVIETPKEEE